MKYVTRPRRYPKMAYPKQVEEAWVKRHEEDQAARRPPDRENPAATRILRRHDADDAPPVVPLGEEENSPCEQCGSPPGDVLRCPHGTPDCGGEGG